MSDGAAAFVDLTQRTTPSTPLGGPLPKVELSNLWSLSRGDIANISLISMASHSGTHIDAPDHVVHGGRSLSDIPLEWLIGPASFVDVPREEHGEITAADLERAGTQVLPGDRVFLRTGFTDRYDSGDVYLRHPFVTVDAAQWMVERQVRLLAIDTVTPECPRTLRDNDGFGFPVHHELLGNDVLIVENARIPSTLPARFSVSILPMRLDITDGAPVRIVATVNGG